MIQKAMRLQIKTNGQDINNIKNYQELLKTIKANYSKQYMKKLFIITTGQFDIKQGWSQNMAGRYWGKINKRYTNKKYPKVRTYYFTGMARWSRSDLNRIMQNIGKNANRKYLLIILPPKKKNNRHRRSIGRFYDYFMKTKGKLQIDNGQTKFRQEEQEDEDIKSTTAYDNNLFEEADLEEDQHNTGKQSRIGM